MPRPGSRVALVVIMDRPSSRLARLSALATAVVAVAFALTIALTMWELRPIEARSDALTMNALPSARHMSVARSDLHELFAGVRTYLLAEDAARAEDAKRRVSDARKRLDDEVNAYETLPLFPGEPQLAAELDHSLALLDEHLPDVMTPRPNRAALGARFAIIVPRVDAVDDTLFRLQKLNIDAGLEQANSIKRMQDRAELAGALCSLISLALAFVTALLVRRLVHRQEREAELHQELLVARATELDAFAGRVAHDLKNPLAAMAMRLSIVQGRQVLTSDELRGHIDRAGHQVERMNHMIDGLLEFARAGATPSPGASAELRPILDDVVAELKPSAELARAELNIEPFATRPLACTPGALTSVLSNLIGNAVKYIVDTRRPERTIFVRVVEHDGVARVEVEDTGPGIPPDFAEQAFRPFARLGNTKQPGTGLGLATVKRIVETYGGKVGVRSDYGRGSRFWFELPLVSRAEGAPSSA